MENKIDLKELIIKILIPTTLLSTTYLVLGHFCKIPHLLLFCILGTIFLVPTELGMICRASKKEYGVYSLESAFTGQEKLAVWKIVVIAFCFFGLAGFLSAIVAPITEELFFRGYLTSHYEKQNSFTPILIAILFSLYHFWLPFNNIFRILIFAPVSYVAYKKKNIYISICFHCFCNLFSTINFAIAVLG